MKTAKFSTLAVVLLLAFALTAALLVACDPSGGKDDSTGGGTVTDDNESTGDAIFTEGVTLAEILVALDAAESATYTYFGEVEGYEYNYVFSLTRDCVVAEAVDKYQGTEQRATYYAVLKDGVFYDVAYEDGQWSVNKNLASNTDADNLPSGLFDGYVYTVPYALEEVDGKLQPKDGTGVLSLDGDSVTLTFEEKENGVTVQKEVHSLSLVNATEATVSADALERINAADWADSVYYNGVTYSKVSGGENGQVETVYFYDVRHVPAGVTPEDTINGFPAIATGDNDPQPSEPEPVFSENMSVEEFHSVIENADSMLTCKSYYNELGYFVEETYYMTRTAVRTDFVTRYADGTTVRATAWAFEYNGKCYSVGPYVEGEDFTVAEVPITMDEAWSQYFNIPEISAIKNTADGIAVNEERLAEMVDGYVVGTASIVTGADCYSFSYEVAGAPCRTQLTVGQVNGVTLTVPQELIDRIGA